MLRVVSELKLQQMYGPNLPPKVNKCYQQGCFSQADTEEYIPKGT